MPQEPLDSLSRRLAAPIPDNHDRLIVLGDGSTWDYAANAHVVDMEPGWDEASDTTLAVKAALWEEKKRTQMIRSMQLFADLYFVLDKYTTPIPIRHLTGTLADPNPKVVITFPPDSAAELTDPAECEAVVSLDALLTIQGVSMTPEINARECLKLNFPEDSDKLNDNQLATLLAAFRWPSEPHASEMPDLA